VKGLVSSFFFGDGDLFRCLVVEVCLMEVLDMNSNHSTALVVEWREIDFLANFIAASELPLVNLDLEISRQRKASSLFIKLKK
jgi:hypothetical protein